MAGKVDYVMATELGLDVTPATRSLSALKSSVNIVTKGWQQQVTALKSAGDNYGALEAKTDGLSKAIELQQKAVDDLTKKQQDAINIAKNKAEQEASVREAIAKTKSAMEAEVAANNKSTDTYKALRQELLAYQKQARDINNVDKVIRSTTASLEYQKTKLASLQSQYRSAKSELDDYNSGLAKLKQSYADQNALSTARVDRLKAEGNTLASLKEQQTNFKNSISNLNSQLDAEKSKLSSMQSSGNFSDSAILKQKIAVEQTATALARAKSSAKSVDAQMSSMNITVWDRLKNKIIGADTAQQQATAHVQKIKGVFSGAFFGNLISSQLPGLSGGLKQIISEGQQAAAAGGAIEARWKNINVNATGIKQLQTTLSDVKTNTNMSAAAVNGLQTRFYGLTRSVSKTNTLTKGVASLADQLKLSQQQADAFAGGLSRIESSGKVTSQSLGRLEKQAPGLTSAMANASGMTKKHFQELVESGDMTSKQFNKILANASKSYKKNADAFDQTAGGSKHALEQQWKSTEATIAKPLLQVQGQIFGQLRKSLSDKNTQQGIVMLAKGFATLAVDASKLLGVLAKHQTVVKALVIGFGSLAVSIKSIRTVNSTIATFKLLSTSLRAAGVSANVLKVALGTGVIGAVIAVGVGLTELYKHNAKFRKFVNGIASGIKNKLGSAANWVKHNWRSVGGYIVNPVGSALTRLYKTNPKFRKFANGLASAMINSINRQNRVSKQFWTKTLPKTINAGKSLVGKAVKAVVKVITAPFRNLFKWLKNSLNTIKSKVSHVTKSAKSKIRHRASGGSATEDELAVVNDAHDPNYEEALDLGDGTVVPFGKKRNQLTVIPKGAKVINGEEFKRLKDDGKIQHHASGTEDVNNLVTGLNSDAQNWKNGTASTFNSKLIEEFTKEIKKFQQQIAQALATFTQRKADADSTYNATTQKANVNYTATTQQAQKKVADSVKKAQQTKAEAIAKAQQSRAQKMQKAQQSHAEKLAKSQQAHAEKLAKAQQAREDARQKAQQKLQTSLAKAQQKREQAVAKAKTRNKESISKADSTYKSRLKKAKTPQARKAARRAHTKALKKAQATLTKSLDRADKALTTSKSKAQSTFDTTTHKADLSSAKTTNSANVAFQNSTLNANQALAKSVQSANESATKSIQSANDSANNSIKSANDSFANTMSNAVIRRNKAFSTAKITQTDTINKATNARNATVSLAQSNIARLQDWKQKNERALDFSMSAYANGGIANKPSIFGEAGLEAAVPLDPSKENSAWTQIATIASMYAGNGGRIPGQSSGSDSDLINALLAEVKALKDLVRVAFAGVEKGQLAQIDATKSIPGYSADKTAGDVANAINKAYYSSLY